MTNFRQLVKVDLRSIEALQFEASFSYKLSTAVQGKLVQPKEYEVNSYLILPHQFQASPNHYSMEDFYRDLRSFFSFRFPKLSFKEIIADDNERSPLYRIESFINSHSAETLNGLEYSQLLQEAKLWSCSLYYFTDRKAAKLKKLIDANEKKPKLSQCRKLILENCGRMKMVLDRWQSLKETLLGLHQAGNDELYLIDEYICSILRDFTLTQLELIQNGDLSEELEREVNRLRAVLRLIRWHMIRCDYLWVDDTSSQQDKREFSYRRGTLKRAVWSALYIQSRPQSLFKLRRQAGAMFAAAIAGFWAGIADLMIWRSSTSPRSMEMSGFIVISALALAYVLKDRIKELGRSRFKGGLLGRVPDNQSHLLFDQGSTAKRPLNIGTYKEKSNYYQSKQLPEDIRILLAKTTDLQENHLHIIRYNKTIKLRRKLIKKLHLKIRAIYDFYRLNLARLMFQADESEEYCQIPTNRLNVAWAKIPKVYKVDLIIKVSGRCRPKLEPYYAHYQMIVSRQGIHEVNWMDSHQEGEAD